MKEKVTLTFLDVLKYARDSRLTTNSQQSLLYHLILRCDPKKDYSCWPGYPLLCRDTGLNETTVKRAARDLEAKGLIKRIVRPNQSNLWYVNVAYIQEIAEANRAADRQADRELSTSPFAPPIAVGRRSPEAPGPTIVTPDTIAQDAELDAPRTKEEEEIVDEVHELLKTHFGDHPTYMLADGERIMAKCVEDCVELAGSPQKCLDVLTWGISDDKLKTTLARKDHLGGYLRACFKNWLAEADMFIADIDLNEILSGDHTTLTLSIEYRGLIPAIIRYLKEQLGDRLLTCEECTSNGEPAIGFSVAAHETEDIDGSDDFYIPLAPVADTSAEIDSGWDL